MRFQQNDLFLKLNWELFYDGGFGRGRAKPAALPGDAYYDKGDVNPQCFCYDLLLFRILLLLRLLLLLVLLFARFAFAFYCC
jgi:hypothetical protein